MVMVLLSPVARENIGNGCECHPSIHGRRARTPPPGGALPERIQSGWKPEAVVVLYGLA
jgi:hypothetical protein